MKPWFKKGGINVSAYARKRILYEHHDYVCGSYLGVDFYVIGIDTA